MPAVGENVGGMSGVDVAMVDLGEKRPTRRLLVNALRIGTPGRCPAVNALRIGRPTRCRDGDRGEEREARGVSGS
jgi:hypothetical protein